jgi:hypothetical protein
VGQEADFILGSIREFYITAHGCHERFDIKVCGLLGTSGRSPAQQGGDVKRMDCPLFVENCLNTFEWLWQTAVESST